MERRGDGEEVVFVHRKEEGSVVGEEVLEDVDVAKTHRERRTDPGRFIVRGIGGADKGDVAGHDGVVASVRMGPWRGLGERGGYAHGFGELPVTDVVHDLGEDLDGEIGRKHLPGSRPLAFLLVSRATTLGSTVFCGEVVVVDIESHQS